MSGPSFFRLVFALYCVEAGVFFLTAPWLPAWERLVFSLPWSVLRDAAMSGWTRGVVTGFGLIHLVWALHDIDLYFRRRRPDGLATSATAGGH